MSAKKSRFPRDRRGERSQEEGISRNLSYILRHGAARQGIAMRNDGFVKVSDLVSKSCHYATRINILRLAACDAKISLSRFHDLRTCCKGERQEALYPSMRA